MVGLPFYVQEAGSPTLLWAGPLVSGWTLMRRGFVKHSPKPRYTAYRASALSMAATAVTILLQRLKQTRPVMRLSIGTLSGRRCLAAAR